MKLFNSEDMKNYFEISHWDNGVYVLVARNKNVYSNEKEFVIMLNPTDKAISFELDDYYTVMEGVTDEKLITTKNGFLPACKMLVLFKK